MKNKRLERLGAAVESHRLSAIVLILMLLGTAWLASADKKPQLRELTGLVTDRSEAPLDKAVVYLKNSRTLVVKTFITSDDGKYRFPALAQNVDYEVYAEREGRKSETKTLSSFDSRPQVNIHLRIDTGK
jgi:hypothetical protein